MPWSCPGRLPVLNQTAVESAIRIGLALNCEIAVVPVRQEELLLSGPAEELPDQSQYDEPIAINGYLDVPLDDGTTWRVEIERAHMEEDTGKLDPPRWRRPAASRAATTSLLDYNRAGVPLIEIVTKPIEGTGARAPEIARAYVTALRDLLRAPGCIRCADGSGFDALRRQRLAQADRLRRSSAPAPRPRTSTRCKSVEVAVRYEMRRQAAVLTPGGRGAPRRPGTSTRTAWPPRRAAARKTAQDYRYFPEPDLVPMAPDAGLVGPLQLKAELPGASVGTSRKRTCRRSGPSSDASTRDPVNNGAFDLIEAMVEKPGRPSDAARASGGWANSSAALTKTAWPCPSCRSARLRWPRL